MKHFFPRALVVSVMVITISSGWGFFVHRTVNQLAVYQLPKALRGFFYIHMDTVVQHSIRPDQRRNSDPTEATKHFIDLEPFGDSAAVKMPLHWEEAVQKFTRDTLLKYGHLPYWVVTMKDRLTNAFKGGNSDSILFYSADIAHYIGDAHVPLHTSLYYDGQNTNMRGLHALWESTVPELALSEYHLGSRHKANYLAKPEEAIWGAIRHSHTLLPEMWQQEREATKEFTDSTKYRLQTLYGREVKGYTTAFAKAYNKRIARMVNQQLVSTSNLIADFWYTAWVDAGKPNMEKISGRKKKVFKKERRAFKSNSLIEKNLLISKKKKVADPSVTQ